MTLSIETIYRYPVKGLPGERLERADLVTDQPLPQDRRFAIARGTGLPGSDSDAWQPKSAFHQLEREERLAQLRPSFDADSGLLTLERHGREVARGKASDPMGRALLNQFFGAFLGAGGPGTARLVEAKGFAFADVDEPLLSLVNLASVRDIERVAGRPIDPRRFRANLYVEGPAAWEEENWEGRVLTCGSLELEVLEPIERCGATNVDPDTAARDMNLPLLLQRGFGHCHMGVYLRVRAGGSLAAGNSFTLKN